MWRFLFLLVAASAVCWRAEACEQGVVVPRGAIPRRGAAGVAPSSAIVVLADSEPDAVSLTADGAPQSVLGVALLGAGIDGVTGGRTGFWRVSLPSALQAGATHVLTENGTAGGRELTRFTTTAASGTPAATAPRLRALRLWRVHYPIRAPDGADCVTAPDQGFITLDADPAVIDGTPPDSVVHTIRLGPRTGGGEQVFLFTGPAAYAGAAPAASGFPTPDPADWHPDLTGATELCAVIQATGFGRSDGAALQSERVCATVTSLEAARDSAGCCTVAGRSGSASDAGALAAVLALGAAALVRRRPRGDAVARRARRR